MCNFKNLLTLQISCYFIKQISCEVLWKFNYLKQLVKSLQTRYIFSKFLLDGRLKGQSGASIILKEAVLNHKQIVRSCGPIIEENKSPTNKPHGTTKSQNTKDCAKNPKLKPKTTSSDPSKNSNNTKNSNKNNSKTKQQAEYLIYLQNKTNRTINGKLGLVDDRMRELDSIKLQNKEKYKPKKQQYNV
ncbi:Hypothetical_protein [Hexamita inflata]|uniref:Hypothetical_protein n=1 Tax=Hexamita inflata TaxID=28002 RepID=A0AA86TSN6_9EUKA|nr:Hypothetical protein HINF_LOCUS8553 [Hexamita inflata]